MRGDGCSEVADLLGRFLRASDRERVLFLLILGIPSSLLGGFLALNGSGDSESVGFGLLLGLAGFLMLFGAAVFSLKWGIQAAIRKRRMQADRDRREILQEIVDRPSTCTACGAWNSAGSEYCGECGAALEGVEL